MKLRTASHFRDAQKSFRAVVVLTWVCRNVGPVSIVQGCDPDMTLFSPVIRNDRGDHGPVREENKAVYLSYRRVPRAYINHRPLQPGFMEAKLRVLW
jgi:hypothetical protein